MSLDVDYRVNFIQNEDIYLDVLGRIDERDRKKLLKTHITNNIHVQAKSTKTDDVLGTLMFRIRHGSLYVEHLNVKKEYRNQGVGKCLVSYLEYFAIDHNIQKVSGNVTEESKEFYKNLGYEIKRDDAFYLSPTHEFNIPSGYERGDIFYKSITDENVTTGDFVVKDLRSTVTEDYGYGPNM